MKRYWLITPTISILMLALLVGLVYPTEVFGADEIREGDTLSSEAHQPDVISSTGNQTGQQGQDNPPPTPAAELIPQVRDESCLACHNRPEFSAELQNGNEISLFVAPSVYYNSSHGEAGLGCISCHAQNFDRYPHHVQYTTCADCHIEEEGLELKQDFTGLGYLPYESEREYIFEANQSCETCHEEQFEEAKDSGHGMARSAGNELSPLCTDCHTAHDVQPPSQPVSRIPETCASCHQSTYSTYAISVHGEAVLENQDANSPTCITCHGVHSIRDPFKAEYRADIPQLCASCHANEELMDKYGVSTDVFNTYLQDFHGKTVENTRLVDPTLATETATCTDCHGVHDIRSVDSENSMVIRSNLLNTCQQCHTGAPEGFESAWLPHHEPDLERHPAAVIAELIYAILIPGTMGMLGLYITLDIYRRHHPSRRLKVTTGNKG